MKKEQASRRQFIQKTGKAILTLPLLGYGLSSCHSELAEQAAEKPSRKKLNILILGGTSFLGPHQIAYALGRGHTVSTFTRGKTKPTIYQDLFEQVEQLIGDRKDDLKALENRKWDVVIDNSCRDVEWAKASADLLKEQADLYLITSSTGVYYPYLGKDIKEDTPLVMEEPAEVEDEDMKIEYWYGVMKATSELAVEQAFGKERTLVVRPTYMMGPADKTDRFIHWPIRLVRGGEVLVPGKATDPVQYIDVRDVAEWMIRLLEEKQTGVYNAVGPKLPQNMHAFAEEAKGAFDVETTLVKIDDYDFLKKHKVDYLVPWIPPEGNNQGSALANNEKAIKAGLTFRNLQQSIKDTHRWWYSDALTDERRNKVEQKEDSVLVREEAILAAWAAVKK